MNDFGSPFTRRCFLVSAGAAATTAVIPAFGRPAEAIAPQPYFAGVNRAIEAMAKLGAPLAAQDVEQIAALAKSGTSEAVQVAESTLERYTLARLSIAASGAGHIMPGGAPKTLVEQAWRMFLIRVANPAGHTDAINFSRGLAGAQTAGQMLPQFSLSQRAWLADTLNKAPLIADRWLLAQMYGATPNAFLGFPLPTVVLSGIPVEYHVIELFSNARGSKTTDLLLTVVSGKSTGIPLGVPKRFQFDCLPTRDIRLGIKDVDGRGCMASIVIKDELGRIYPPQAMRLAPDLAFQPQVYRADGETVRLPDGEYTLESRRGPEYLSGTQTVRIGASQDAISVNLRRWIDPAHWGWYSGDTHIHAAGCAHYAVPTEGVAPETMIRQVRGEGLAIGDILTWAPGWYYQKQFFTGHTESPAATLEHPELQAANNASLQPRSTPEDTESLLRYDVEVSGFPSSASGHLVLLRLKNQDYPGTQAIEDWPSWNLPILKWARSQGAVAGYAHCGAGMVVDSTDLPNYEIPPFDSVGTNEAIVDVTHGFADFLSGCNTVALAELNAWYHMLNCGFRLGMLGETDYPCVTGERPGVGRSYVWLAQRPAGDVGYDAWVRNLQKGSHYCGDGRSHFLKFTVQGHASGEDDLLLTAAGTIQVEGLVAARLEPQPTPETEAIRTGAGGGWHLEHARIGQSRDIPVELVVNGAAVERRVITADGTPQAVHFNTTIAHSSWVALRILPSAHTHPVFVTIAGRPIRASRRSAQWCRTCVDKLWDVKSGLLRDSERPQATEAYDHARRTYETILQESTGD